MAFIQCTAEQAERFVQFMLESGSWCRAPVGNWIAHRLTKIKPTTEADPHHSVLDALVIHRNSKGIHSFDPLFEKAFTAALAQELKGGLEGFIGETLNETQRAAAKSAMLKALAASMPESIRVLDSKVQPDGRVDFTISIPPELAEKMGFTQ